MFQLLYAGIENLKHYEAYEAALRSGLALTMRYLKFLYLGPPRSGKSSTRRRLLQEIVNLRSIGEPSISTGVAETNDVVIKKLTSELTAISGSEWWSMKRPKHGRELDMYGEGNLNYLAQFFCRLISKSNSKTGPATISTLTSQGSESESDQPGLAEEQDNTILSDPHSPEEAAEKEVNQAFEKLTSVLQSDSPEDLRQILEELTLINNVDIGGQPAFLELCTAFTSGPALYFIFFRLDQELRKSYRIKFVDADKKEVVLESSYCIETVIHQLLSSIACFGSQSSTESAALTSEALSCALLFGTHKDRVNRDHIAKVDLFLRRQLCRTKIGREALLLRTSEDKFFFSVDNMTGDESEMSPIRKDIEKIIHQFFPSVPIPASWLMFRIMLHYMQKPVVSITQCELIAKQLSMTTPVQEAIWFFHNNVGSLMHYPDIPSLKDVVICDLQIVFDSTSELIIDTFKIGNRAIPPSAVDDFHDKGQFSLSHIKDRTEHRRNNQLSLEQLVDLLKHHNILAEIKHDQDNSGEPGHHQESANETNKSQPRFIMPAVLKSASEDDLIITAPTSTNSDQKATPLIILFKDGFVPFGLFCASTANLIARQDSLSPSWRLHGKLVMKNKVTFIIGKVFIATLISRPQFIEIRVEKNQQIRTKHELQNICSSVREIVVETLETVISKMKYKRYSKMESSSKQLFDLAFTCDLDDSHSDHFMVVASSMNNKIYYGKCLKDCLRLCLVKEHLLWFSGHILMKSELRILANLLAVHSDEKLKEIKAAIEEKEGGDISLEEVERSLRERGLNSIADSLKDNLEKGKSNIYGISQ